MMDASDPEFQLSRPEDIRSALFELTHPDSHTLVRDAADREIAVLILGVDKHAGVYFWRPRDFDGADFDKSDSLGLLTGTNFQFHATAYGGVQIRFNAQRPEVIHFDDGSAALVSPYPDRVTRIQRRKMFRAPLTTASFRCTATWTGQDSKPLVFSLRDISVDGVGLRAEVAVIDLPERGAMLEGVQLDFGEFGKLRANLEVRNVYPVSGQKKPAAAPSPDDLPVAKGTANVAAPAAETPLSHIGAVFTNLDARQETWLQQVVWRLERGSQRGG